MPFSMKERETLLAIRGIGPMVLKRLEEMRLDSLAKLSRTSAPDIAAAIAAQLNSSCWRNRPQTLAALEAAIGLARSRPTQPEED